MLSVTKDCRFTGGASLFGELLMSSAFGMKSSEMVIKQPRLRVTPLTMVVSTKAPLRAVSTPLSSASSAQLYSATCSW
eukprot:18446-Heterococcus_DN1.PRE.1